MEPGPYRSSRTPWAEEILLELSPQSPTNEVVAIKPTQMGFTTIANIALCATAHRYPGPAMLVQPTDDMVKKHSKKKLAPTVAAIPCLKGVIKKSKSRDSGNTLLLKEFPGGSWTLTGSNSPVSARSDSIRYLILDDYNGFIPDAGGEGAPGDLFKKRTDAFGNKKKIYINSTPTEKGASNIDDEFEESSQGYFSVPCPHCAEYQYLVFGGPDAEHGIKFDRDEDGQIIDVWYVCQHCHGRIEEWQKTEMLSKPKYIHKFPDRKKRGFKVNSLYSPLGWVSWKQIAEEFLKAAKALRRGDSRQMKVWTNTRMSESYEVDGEQPEWEKLAARAEPYKMLTVPKKAGRIVAGVDTQDNRLEVVVMAYGRNWESWVIYKSTLYGDPDQPGVWAQLDELLYRQYAHESGAELEISAMGIDSGGHKTHAVYNYCRTRNKAFAIKGSSSKNAEIIGPPKKQDVNLKGKKLKKGVETRQIGTHRIKQTIYDWLQLAELGWGYIHFPIGLEDEFYKQLTAEKLETKYNKAGYAVKEWQKTRERNDILDCVVYCYAMAQLVGVYHLNWDQIEKTLSGYQQRESVQKKHWSQRTRPASPLSGRNLNPHNRR